MSLRPTFSPVVTPTDCPNPILAKSRTTTPDVCCGSTDRGLVVTPTRTYWAESSANTPPKPSLPLENDLSLTVPIVVLLDLLINTPADHHVESVAKSAVGKMESASETPQLPSTHSLLSHLTLPSQSVVEAMTLPTIPNYHIRFEIARGGMGRILAADDLTLHREVALKMLLPGADVARFLTEAQITAQLPHPCIPPVYGLGFLEDHTPYLVMKRIYGQNLHDLLRSRHSPQEDLPRWLQVFEQIAQAVAYAHENGIIHRDLKPHNVMVGEFGEVQVMDWGLAKQIYPAPVAAVTPVPAAVNQTAHAPSDLTNIGSVLGTPGFMAPEQARGEAVDERADVFALGGILTTILTNQPVFIAATAQATIQRAAAADLEDTYLRLAQSGADNALLRLAKRCLAARPEDRPTNAQAVADAIAAYRDQVATRLAQAERDQAAALVREQERGRRQRLFAWAAGMLIGVLSLGIGTTATALYFADQAQQTAQHNADEAQMTLSFLVREILAAARPKGPDGGMGRDVKLLEVIEPCTAILSEQFATKPLVEAEIRKALADTFIEVGEFSKAVTEFQKILAIHQREFGPEDFRSVVAMNNLGAAYLKAGQVESGLALLEQTVTEQQAILGPEHTETLATQANLASGYKLAGEPTKAYQLREAVFTIQKRVLGPVHEDTLLSMANLAVSLTDLSRWQEALTLHEAVLNWRLQKLGPEHPQTLISMNNLAHNLMELGQVAAALPLQRKTFVQFQRLLGVDHPDTLQCIVSLVRSLTLKQQHAELITLLHANLRHFEKVLGTNHTQTLWCKLRLIESLFATHQGAEGLIHLAEFFQIADQDPAEFAHLILDGCEQAVRYQATQKDPAGCRSWTRHWQKYNRQDSFGLFASASFWAVTASVQRDQGDAAATMLSRADQDQALDYLKKAVAAGFNQRAQLEQDKDLQILHDRPEFQEILRALPAQP